MEEIKAGEYVKTKTGRIYKLGYYNKKEERWICVTDEDWFPVYESEIAKHSFNIIDLIEVGDLVKIEDNCGAIHWFEVYENSGIHQYDILEIATKEIMKSISYKVIKEQFNQIKYEV